MPSALPERRSSCRWMFERQARRASYLCPEDVLRVARTHELAGRTSRSKGLTELRYAQPQTSRAVSTTRRSLAISCSTLRSLPCSELEKPHCGLSASDSSGR
jgi:hypothetical protein